MKLSIQVLAFVANLPSLTLAAPVEPVAEPQLVSDLKERNELVRRNGPVGYTIGPVGGGKS